MATEIDLETKLQKLIWARMLFSTLLLGSTLFMQAGRGGSTETAPLIALYALIALIFLLSSAYGIVLKRRAARPALAYVQTGVDTLIVTLILVVTGGFSSPFSFLYLVVIVTSSLLLSRRGTVLIAALCSVQFGLLADLEFYGILNLPGGQEGLMAAALGWDEILYKIMTVMAACVVVAFLSSFLSEQALRTRRELRVMEQYVKRVEKMAAVGEMAAGLAHEIKNPLASLAGAIQLLREEIRCDPDHDRLMQIILREADRLSSLVSNFLLYARPPAGKKEAVDLEAALRETVELFGKKGAAAGRIRLCLNAQAGIWVEMDPAHLRQVVWNLLINASEAIEGDGSIRVELTSARGRQACLTVCDTGAGMPAEILQSIFDPFFTTKPNGTGLGLSIVHRILEAYGCRLDVDSTPGQGTTFRLHFRQIQAPPGGCRTAASSQLGLDTPVQISY
jgi:two-component system sensor histidine kinase PilS (NtrC family)